MSEEGKELGKEKTEMLITLDAISDLLEEIFRLMGSSDKQDKILMRRLEKIRRLIQNPKPKVKMKLVEKYWERFCAARYEGFEDNCSIEEFCQMFKKLGMEIEQK